MNTPEDRLRHYRFRAKEIRTVAEEMDSPESRATYLRMASAYEVMADGIEAKHNLRRAVEASC